MNEILFEWNLLSKYRKELFGIAALMIIIHHLTIRSLGALTQAYMFVRVQGAVGVDIFLLLSGIGLMHSYSANGLKKFYYRRFIRIVPVYLLVCIPWYIYWCMINGESFIDFLGYIFQLKFWIEGNGGEWYIVFIVFLYILYPLLYNIIIVSKQRNRNRLFILLLWIIIVVCVRIFLPNLYSRTCWIYPRFPVFFVGVILGEYVKKEKKINYFPIIIISCFCFFVFMCLEGFLCLKGPEYGYSFWARLMYLPISLSLVILLSLFFAHREKKKVIFEPLHKFINWIGEYSLESYLIHQKAIYIFRYIFGFLFDDNTSNILGNLIGVGVTLLLVKPIHLVIKKVVLTNKYIKG